MRREKEDDPLWEPKSYLREKNKSSLTKEWKRKTKTTILGNQASEDGCQGNSRMIGGGGHQTAEITG